MKIIAESAGNHQGDVTILRELAYLSKPCDYFTCQVMDVDTFCHLDYSRYELYRSLAISHDDWIAFFDDCHIHNIQVIPCVLDETAFRWCYTYGFRRFKLHGTDLTNIPFLTLLSTYSDVSIMLETQCATMIEIEHAVYLLGSAIEVLYTGFSNYPTDIQDTHLASIDSLRTFGYPVGYADHSNDPNIVLMALARGYEYIELHITNGRHLRHYDWQVSYESTALDILVATLRHYEQALGHSHKHPCFTERTYRLTMYKKIIAGETKTMQRHDEGTMMMNHLIRQFKDGCIAIVARLTSTRLPRKVMLPFGSSKRVIHQIYESIRMYADIPIYIATSLHQVDEPLVQYCQEYRLPVFRGCGVSVLERMLQLAFQEKRAWVVRVTGDNVFTSGQVLGKMIDAFRYHDLDYMRCCGLPFGMSAELFSTAYLWKLYLTIESPADTEYLTWFVVNDNEARRGCMFVDTPYQDIERVHLSIDTDTDYERCLRILNECKTDDVFQIHLDEILACADHCQRIDLSTTLKLPRCETDTMKLVDYISLLTNLKWTMTISIQL